jgi:hypothetical protein
MLLLNPVFTGDLYAHGTPFLLPLDYYSLLQESPCFWKEKGSSSHTPHERKAKTCHWSAPQGNRNHSFPFVFFHTVSQSDVLHVSFLVSLLTV